MSDKLFNEYRGVNPRDGVIAAAVITSTNMIQLSQVTGGTAVSKKVRGGSMVYSGLLLHGVRGRVGDYVWADRRAFRILRKEQFEEKFKPKGPLRDASSERR